MLTCPVCQSPLARQDRQLRCDNNHSYDQAKQGYFNLLLNTAKKSKQPGDNAAMVQARSAFLNAGHYQSISDTINQLAIDQLLQNQTENVNVLDLGCGEGYYSDRLNLALNDHQIQHEFYGLDISKDAVKSATKRSKAIHWLVANANQAPFAKNSMALILNVFNRIMPNALANLCHPKGRVLIASAGAYHLQQLKEAIYENPRFVEFDAISTMAEYFEHEHRQTLDFTIKLDPNSTEHLIGMTPHAWRSAPNVQQGLLSQQQLELRVQINLDSFTLKPSALTAVDEEASESE
ncbi:methyltransferase domain-containing protein [Oceaniserpentilla sp. 4NH20-0058]|uniref:putative RNA methyltransferase n=1 Tax=Oceaniserpentilla sp. 4NH20-0058 TaxID=3127660 RepID=UPI0031071386